MQAITDFKTTITKTAHAVIFDLDGVLMDSEWLAFIAWRELAARYGGALPETAYPEMIGTAAQETAAIVMRRTGVTFDITPSVHWTWNRVSEWIRAGVDPLPGGTSLVQELTRRGYPLAIASNSTTGYIENALIGLKLLDYFQIKVGIDQVSQGKPAPDVYLRAARLAGALPERCLVIEDSRVGVQAAASAGMRVVAVPDARDDEYDFHGAWKIFRSLEDVIENLDDLLTWPG